MTSGHMSLVICGILVLRDIIIIKRGVEFRLTFFSNWSRNLTTDCLHVICACHPATEKKQIACNLTRLSIQMEDLNP